MKNKIIDYLFENANPSIVLRVKKEILNTISEVEEAQLMEKILTDKNVKIVIDSQKENGWIGRYFHGAGVDSMETGLRFLAEKGLSFNHSIINKAVQALIDTKKDSPLYGNGTGMSKVLKIPENDYKYTALGLYLARSSIIIRAGYENIVTSQDYINLHYDIEQSLKCFFNVLQIEKPEDVLYRRRNKLCFIEGTFWPCIYDLRILAHSKGWRSKENYDALFKSINKLYEWPQEGEYVYTYISGFIKAPAQPYIHRQIMESVSNTIVSGIYFDHLELFARCGAVSAVDTLKKEYEMLINLISNDLTVNFEIKNRYALGWGAYTGFAIEEDWKNKVRKQCDILFRILLIIHYTERIK